MTVRNDYRKYLESEFKAIHTRLKDINDINNIKFDSIIKQTTKTNDRVGHLEECVQDLKIKEVEHVQNCPAMPKITEIQADLLEYRFFKKYPKLAVMLIVMFVIMAGFTVYRAIKAPAEFTEVNKKIEDEVRMHGGVPNVVRGAGGKIYMKVNDQGLQDTIRIK